MNIPCSLNSERGIELESMEIPCSKAPSARFNNLRNIPRSLGVDVGGMHEQRIGAILCQSLSSVMMPGSLAVAWEIYQRD